MEASEILFQTGEAAARARRRPLLRLEDELLFAADPRRAGEVFSDPALRLMQCDAARTAHLLPQAAQEGVQRGDQLFAILDETGALLHHSVLHFSAPALALLGEAPSVPLIGRCATAPAARGKRLYPRTLRHIMAELAARRCARVAIYCDRDNAASIRGIRRAGFAEIAHLTTAVIGERWALQRRRPGGLRLVAL
jgi:RimJ/RimL family protein N-acetyltransferase